MEYQLLEMISQRQSSKKFKILPITEQTVQLGH